MAAICSGRGVRGPAVAGVALTSVYIAPAEQRRRCRPLARLVVLIGGAVAVLLAVAQPARWAASFVCGPPGSAGAAASAAAGVRLNAAAVETADPPSKVADAELAGYLERLASAKEIEELAFWKLVDNQEVAEAIILKWNDKQLLARLKDGSFVAVREEYDVEDLRDRLVQKEVVFRYPKVDSLSEEEALETAQYTSEGAVAVGTLAALAVGIADSALEISAAAVIAGADIEGQSLLENESPGQVIAEDFGMLNKDLRFLERAAERAEKVVEADVQVAERLAAAEVKEAGGFFENSLSSTAHWCQDVYHGLFANHAPGLGGIIEDSFMGLLTAVSLFSLYQMAFLKRKSSSFSGLAHTATGAMQIVTVLYAVLEERCLRESPGPVWAVFTFAIFMVNNITMWPLLKYFKGPEVQRVLFKLAYSFIISFQGIHCIAWSIQYDWLYWAVMPFWFYSIKKLSESTDYILALLPEGTLPEWQEGAQRRLKGIQKDTPTVVYSALNFGGAVFDNLYMAVYTWRGPAGFWGWSMANIPAVNDHLRTGLVKPSFGSLTISILVFLATLVYRKKMPANVAIALNVVLASVGPWLILYYHKLIDFDEPWQPEIMGDWGNLPYFVTHFSDLGAIMAKPLAMLSGG